MLHSFWLWAVLVPLLLLLITLYFEKRQHARKLEHIQRKLAKLERSKAESAADEK